MKQGQCRQRDRNSPRSKKVGHYPSRNNLKPVGGRLFLVIQRQLSRRFFKTMLNTAGSSDTECRKLYPAEGEREENYI